MVPATQLSQLFSSILLCLSFAGATPLNKRSPGKLISVPVKHYQYEPNLHPLIAAEQLANRVLQRIARMSGSPAIPRETLERNLMRRVLEVEGPAGLEKRRSLVLDKRLNLYGSPTPASIDRILAGAEEPDPITKANPPTANNSLGLDIDGSDGFYLATIQIGTPARNFSVVMDSGSADFWVDSDTCVSNDRGCGNHVTLGNYSSASFNDTGVPWSVDYFGVSVSGTKVKDNVTIDGLKLPGFSFGVANNKSSVFNTARFDGVMGLGRSKLSKQKNPVSVEVLADARLIEKAIVSYKLGRPEKNDGEVTFGGLDPRKFIDSTLVTVPNVNDNGSWSANLSDVKVDGKSLGLQGPREAIFDTGSSIILIPVADAEAVHKNIPGSGSQQDGDLPLYNIPCNTTTVISLAFNGHSFEINPKDLSIFPSNVSGLCVSGFVPRSDSNSQWDVGVVFLKNVYLSTDFESNTISLANLTHN